MIASVIIHSLKQRIILYSVLIGLLLIIIPVNSDVIIEEEYVTVLPSDIIASTPPTPTTTTQLTTVTVTAGAGAAVEINLPKAEVYLGTEIDIDTLILLNNVSNTDILIENEQVMNGSLFYNVILVCSAEYPIVWNYNGDGNPTRLFSSEIRTFDDFYNVSSYEYFTTLVLMQERNNEHLTGTYTCQSVESSNIQVFYHLYFPGPYGFPTIRNRIIYPPKNDSHVLLPCKATNPTLPMTLFKVHPKEQDRNLTASQALTYNPRLGFTLNMNDLTNPYGTYYCSVNESDSFWKMDLVPRKYEEFSIEPDQELITQENFINQTFKCNSKEKIIFGFPNSIIFGKIEYSENLNSNFPYNGEFTINSEFPLSSYTKYFKIQCLIKKSRRILHTWELSSIGPEEITIKYDTNMKRILCCSKSGLSPRYDFVKCETITDCNIKSNCFQNGHCEYPFPPKFVDAPPGCTAVEFMERVPTHFVKCSVGDKSHQVAITETINHVGIILENGQTPPTDQILKITMLSLRQNTNEIKIKCSGSLFYFSTKFIFALEKLNGSLEFSKNYSIENEESHDPIMKIQVSNDIKNILCFAPLSKSSEWRNVTLPITISGSSTLRTTTTTVRASNVRSSSRRRTQPVESINII